MDVDAGQTGRAGQRVTLHVKEFGRKMAAGAVAARFSGILVGWRKQLGPLADAGFRVGGGSARLQLERKRVGWPPTRRMCWPTTRRPAADDGGRLRWSATDWERRSPAGRGALPQLVSRLVAMDVLTRP